MSAREELRDELRQWMNHDEAHEADEMLDKYRDEIQREDAATVRAQAPKYLDSPENIAAFLVLDKAAALIEPDGDAEQRDSAKLLWRIREALVYMSQVSQPNEHTLSHIRRYLRGENDGMATTPEQ